MVWVTTMEIFGLPLLVGIYYIGVDTCMCEGNLLLNWSVMRELLTHIVVVKYYHSLVLGLWVSVVATQHLFL